MNTKISAILLALICCIASCENNKEANQTTSPFNQLEKAKWLIGEWRSSDQGVEITEVWIKENDSVYAGISYSVRTTSDTISSERIRLEKQGNRLMYIPVVRNQNRGVVVKFTLTSLKEEELIFENPEHDFPQKISYKLINKDSLLAEITGIYKGKMQSEKFPMHRIK